MKIKKEKYLVEAADADINIDEYIDDKNLTAEDGTLQNMQDASKEEIKDMMMVDIDQVRDKIKDMYKYSDDDINVVDDEEFNRDANAIYRFTGQFDDITGVGEDNFERALSRAYVTSMITYQRFWKDLKKAQAEGDRAKVDALISNRYRKNINATGTKNIFVYGLPGFGKTAGVDEFAEEHHVKLITLTLAGIPSEVFTGIPFPVITPDGKYIQGNVSDTRWQEIIENPDIPYILFFDEVTRSEMESQNLIFNLVNEHKITNCTRRIKAMINRKTGEYKPAKTESATLFLNNLLFCVFACNPGKDLFEGSGPVDDALVSRAPDWYMREGNPVSFKKFVNKLYDGFIAQYIKDCEDDGEPVDQKLLNRFTGQQRIANHLLSSATFTFDSWNDQREIREHNEKYWEDPSFFMDSNNAGRKGYGYGSDAGDPRPWTGLSYRTLLGAISACNGTKGDFLNQVKKADASVTGETGGFVVRPSKIEMLETILKSYTDNFSANATYDTKQQAKKAGGSKAVDALEGALDDLDED